MQDSTKYNMMFTPRVMQQGGQSVPFTGTLQSDIGSQRVDTMGYKLNMPFNGQSYAPSAKFNPYLNAINENTNKFFRVFSYLPCLPDSLSVKRKGIIGIIVSLISLLLIIAALVLTAIFVVLPRLRNSNSPKDSFSIDVKNGFLFQSSILGDILSETNRTFEQNATLISGINSLTAQLNEKVKSNLDSNVDRIYNVRLSGNNDLITVSYTIKTKPLSKEASAELKTKIADLLKNNAIYENLVVNNGTLILDDIPVDTLVEEPIKGEIQSKTMILALNENVLQREPILNSNVERDEDVEELLQLRPPKPIDRKFQRKKVIKDHSEIKKIEDKYPYEDYEYKYGYGDDSYRKYDQDEYMPYDSDHRDDDYNENKYEKYEENDNYDEKYVIYENMKSSYENEERYEDEDHGYESENRYDDHYEHDEREYEDKYNRYDKDRHEYYGDDSNRYDSGYENNEYERNNEHQYDMYHDKDYGKHNEKHQDDKHHQKHKLLGKGSEMEESIKSSSLLTNGSVSSDNVTNTTQTTNSTKPSEEKTEDSDEPNSIENLIKNLLSNVKSTDLKKKLESGLKSIPNTTNIQKTVNMESRPIEMKSDSIATTEPTITTTSRNREATTTQLPREPTTDEIISEDAESRDEVDTTPAEDITQSSTRSTTTRN